MGLLNQLVSSLARSGNPNHKSGFFPGAGYGFAGSDFGSLHPTEQDFERLEKLNRSFAGFGDDPQANIQHILSVCAALLEVDMMIYHRISKGSLELVASWGLPEVLPSLDVSGNLICTTMISQAQHHQSQFGELPQGSFYLRELDHSNFAASDPLVKDLGVKTYLGRPVFSGQQVVGAFCALYTSDHPFRVRDEYPLSILASIISVEERRRLALETEYSIQDQLEKQVKARTAQLLVAQEKLEQEIFNHRQTERALRRMANQQEWFVQMARYINESLEITEVLSRIGEGAQYILSGDACAVYLLNSGGKTLKPVLALNEPYQDEVLATPLDVDNSLTGKAVLNRKPMVFNHAHQNSESVLIPGTPEEDDEHMIAAPFIVGESVLGAMTHNRVGEPFTNEELELARTFADFAAAALHNARLYEKMQQTMQDLQESELRYRDLFENAATAIYVADLQGNFIDANQTAISTLGYTREEMLGMQVQDILPESGAHAVRSRISALQEHGSLNFESVHLTKSGRQIPVELNLRLVEQAGQQLIFAIVSDISERWQRNREREVIIQISQALRQASTRDEMFPVLGREIKKIAHACCVRIFIQKPANGVSMMVTEGDSVCPWTQDPEMLETEVRRTMITGEPVEKKLGDHEDQTMFLLSLPLIAQHQAIGAVLIGRDQPFSQAERNNLITVVDIAANALNRASLHEETSRQLQRLEALHNIERAIATILNLDTLLKIVLKHVVELLDVDAADILLYESPGLSLIYAAGQGFSTYSPNPTTLRGASGLAREVVREGRMLYVADLSRHPSGSPALEEWIASEGFCSYLGVPLHARGVVVGVLELFHRQRLSPDLEWRNFLETLANQTAVAIDKTRLLEDLQRTNLELTLAYDKTLEGWAKALELRDKETKNHSEHVLKWTLLLARRMGVPEDQLVHIRRGTLLHDIGKMVVPDEILKKPGPLSPEEWELMRQHPVIAYDLLSPIPYLRPALEIPYCHHERWDGSGYPRGLVGETIPLSARIFAVVDVWDALNEDRYYRPRWPAGEVRQYLIDNAGVLFDPRVVETFMLILDENLRLE